VSALLPALLTGLTVRRSVDPWNRRRA